MTRQELEKFMLQNRLSVEEFHRRIGYSPDNHTQVSQRHKEDS
jgi:hypothetical protein